MSSKYEGFPAVIYSRLWLLQIFGKLKSEFPDLQIKIALFMTDWPPATLIKIYDGNFEIEILENVTDSKDLDDVECDAYLALSYEVFTKGLVSIMKEIEEKRVKVKNLGVLPVLGRILRVF